MSREMSTNAVDFELAAPDAFAKALLANDLRPSGSAFVSAAVPLGSVTRGCYGGSVGSACANLHNIKTVFACGITASVVEHSAALSSDCHPLLASGVVFNADLPPACSRSFRPGPPSDLAQALTMQVSDALAQSGCLDPSQLSLGSRHRIQLHIDSVCLSANGSLPDACLLAVSAALADIRLPQLVATADASRSTDDDDDHAVHDGVTCTNSPTVGVKRASGLLRPALLHPGCAVLCCSFSCPASPVSADSLLLAVPSKKEELLPDAPLVRIFTAGGSNAALCPIRVVSVQMTGCASAELVDRCCQEALARHAASLTGPLGL